jgi:hypothetical protein
LLFFNPDRADVFLAGPWPLPAITFVWLAVAIVTHFHGGSKGGVIYHVGNLFKGIGGGEKENEKKREAGYDAVAIPMDSWAEQEQGKGVTHTSEAIVSRENDSDSPQQEQLLTRHVHGEPEMSAGEYNLENPAGPMAYNPLRQSTEYRGTGTAH